MSYGASLARVGVDVRGIIHPIYTVVVLMVSGLLPPLFEKSMYGLFTSTITSATHHFLENIKSYQFKFTMPSTPTPSTPPPSKSVKLPGIIKHQILLI